FFLRDNPKGLIFERWRHQHGCGRFFNAARDTISDKFIMTYKAGEPKPTIGEAAVPHAPVETYEQLEGEAQ
ncbi:MAG: sarcosine oxidase subunit delta, partial [Shinella sp.]|nr:sarcosine oxidase subunit delta [Shinella sp.]